MSPACSRPCVYSIVENESSRRSTANFCGQAHISFFGAMQYGIEKEITRGPTARGFVCLLRARRDHFTTGEFANLIATV